MDQHFDVRNLIQGGGFIMYPLVVCSIVGTIVFVERLIALFGVKRGGRKLAADVLGHARAGRIETAIQACDRSSSPLGDILFAGLERASDAPEHAGRAMERARSLVAQELKRGLWILGTIGAAAPFVGLFGTVIGIIRSFQDIAAKGSGGFPVVAQGISEALIATGAGIAVAVFAFVANNAFQVKVSNIALEWKLKADELLEALERAPRRIAPAAREVPGRELGRAEMAGARS